MKRSNLHLFTDILLFLGAAGLVLTGLLIAFVLPAGSRQASVWGLTRHEWGDVHFWIALGIIGTSLLHLTLNWGWVLSVIAKLLGLQSTRPTPARKLWTGVTSIAVLVVLVGGFLYTADANRVDATEGRGGGGRGMGQLEHDLEDLFLDDPESH